MAARPMRLVTIRNTDWFWSMPKAAPELVTRSMCTGQLSDGHASPYSRRTRTRCLVTWSAANTIAATRPSTHHRRGLVAAPLARPASPELRPASIASLTHRAYHRLAWLRTRCAPTHDHDLDL